MMKPKVISLAVGILTVLLLVLIANKGIEGKKSSDLDVKIREKILLPNQLAVELRNNLPIIMGKGKMEKITIRRVPIRVLENNRIIKIGEEKLENGVLKIEGKKFRIIKPTS